MEEIRICKVEQEAAKISRLRANPTKETSNICLLESVLASKIEHQKKINDME